MVNQYGRYYTYKCNSWESLPKNGFKFGYVIDVISFLSTDLEVKKQDKEKAEWKRKKRQTHVTIV